MNWSHFFENHFKEQDSILRSNVDSSLSFDPSHDFLHLKRVVSLAVQIGAMENANQNVILPAAWLHDFVNVPKNSHLRSQASQISADKAIEFLDTISYPKTYYKEIHHAICAHSFSAKIEPETLEAKIIQDADRIDGLGAIGIARCFAVSGLLKRSFFSEEDPFCEARDPNDGIYTLDHFYQKLFLVAQHLKTNSGKKIGLQRTEFMKKYLEQLQLEI